MPVSLSSPVTPALSSSKASLAAALHGPSLQSSLGSESEEQTPQPGPVVQTSACALPEIPPPPTTTSSLGPARAIRVAAAGRTSLDRSQAPTYQAASVVGAAGDMPEASLLRDPQSRGRILAFRKWEGLVGRHRDAGRALLEWLSLGVPSSYHMVRLESQRMPYEDKQRGKC